MKRLTIIVMIASAVCCACGETVGISNGDDILLKEGWKLSSDKVSSAYTANVPSTVAGALYDAGYFREDLFESDNYKDVDASVFDGVWTYGYSFACDNQAKHVSLDFDGLGYYADIFVNGEQIASSDTTAGVFISRKYDITQLMSKKNDIEVKLQKAQSGDLNIGFVDWNPRPYGETMGIVRPVHIHAFGEVSIEDVYVKPYLDTETFAEAELEVMVTLRNYESTPVEGQLIIALQDAEDCALPVSLEAFETKEIVLTSAEVASLHIDNPRVWWSWDLGTPELYAMNVQMNVNGTLSDRKSVEFGVRKIESYLNEQGYRQFTLNGRDVLIKGAGWTDDIFLRDTDESLELQAQYVKDMNMNCIRFENIWGKDDSIYDLCDRYGLLAIVGWSCQWEWEDYCGIPEQGRFGCINTPELMDLAVKYFDSQVKRLHNHPSIIAWLTGSDGKPNPELDIRYHEIYDKYDYRPYVCSAKNLTAELSGPSGTKMEGPYEYVGPDYWYLDTNCGGAFGFNTETCAGASIPQKESIERFIPAESLWPLSDIWDYHCTASSSAMNTTAKLQEVINGQYGGFDSLDDFVLKAHAVDYDATRAMFESFRANVPVATGIVQWMLNSAWPSMYWQLYDWYGVPTAGYYAVQKACEGVQLIYNYKDHTVYGVNDTATGYDLTAELKVFDADSKLIYEETIYTGFPIGESLPKFDLSNFCGQNVFVALKLTGEDFKTTTNFYCLPAEGNVYDWEKDNWYITPIKQYADMSFSLNARPQDIECSFEKIDGGVKVTVTNNSEAISSLNILKAMDKDGQLVVPAFWEDNFFALLPGESKTVECKSDKAIDQITIQ